jgi:hypothetical protein
MRFLLFGMAISALPFYWLRRRMTIAAKQAEAVRRVEASGGSVGYSHEWDDKTERFSGNSPPGPEVLRSILGEHFFLTPNLILYDEHSGHRPDLEAVSQLTTVQHLAIVDAPIGDDVVPFVLPLNRLEYLSLYGTQLTDDGLRQLAGLPRLRGITVTNTDVSEAGIDDFRRAHPNCTIYLEDDIDGKTQEPVEQPEDAEPSDAREAGLRAESHG